MRKLPRDPRLLSAAALAASCLPKLREKDAGGGGHSPYFAELQAALKRAGAVRPVAVVDIRRLAGNIAVIRRALASSTLELRVVTKSLQAPGLLASVLAGTGANRLMAFNGLMLEDIVAFRPRADVLLGRPLPAAEVGAFVRRYAAHPAAAAHPQWLADSLRRIAQYEEIARETGAKMRINLELDVGLHRGGLADAAAVAAAVDLVRSSPQLEIAGLMGYDAHVARAPSPADAMARAMNRYGAAVGVLRRKLGDLSGLALNTAGSLTLPFHLADEVANEVSVGSAFVKPAHFDTPALAKLQPAFFIAEPVVKVMDPALYPGREDHAEAIAALDPNSRRGFFLYGGYGDARPVSPAGLKYSALYGGRAMLAGSAAVDLAEDDMVFMRPGESEGALLQFGDIAVYDEGEITAWWPTFRMQA